MLLYIVGDYTIERMATMVEKYIFGYINENEFKKLESALKKYNMLAYKKLYFEYYPKIKAGEFIGLSLIHISEPTRR